MLLEHYILKGTKAVPAPIEEWGQFFETANRHVAQEEIRTPNRLLWWLGLRPDYWVSTMFLGLDHQWKKGGPPLIFETMVFRRWPRWKSWLALPGGRFLSREPEFWLKPLMRKSTLGSMSMWFPRLQSWSESSDQDMDRYSTWEQAEEGHHKMVAKWTLIARGEKERENV